MSNRRRPAESVEDRENQLISAAVDLAERQLLEGTASSQVIVHYLRLGSTKERLEKQKLETENELLKAKIKTLESMERQEELYANAIKAMSIYSGNSNGKDQDD